jgi:serine/threonine protein kinase
MTSVCSVPPQLNPLKEKFDAILSQWSPGALLGEGALGQVFQGHHPVTKELVAIKLLKIPPEIEPCMTSAFVRISHLEASKLKALCALRIPHTVECYASCGHVDDTGTSYGYMTVMEKVGPTLLDAYYRKGCKLSFYQAVTLLKQALEYCAQLESNPDISFIHADFNLGNFSLENNQLSIFDLGNAHEVPLVQAQSTYDYGAPESVFGIQNQYNTDLYSLALIVFDMLAPLPFMYVPHPQPITHEEQIQNHICQLYERFGENVFKKEYILKSPVLKLFFTEDIEHIESPTSKDLIFAPLNLKDRCWKKALENSLKTVKKTQIDQLVQLLECMVEVDLEKRISASHALQHPLFRLDCHFTISCQDVKLNKELELDIFSLNKNNKNDQRVFSLFTSRVKEAHCFHMPTSYRNKYRVILRIADQVQAKKRVKITAEKVLSIAFVNNAYDIS